MLSSIFFGIAFLVSQANAHGFFYSIDGSLPNVRGIEYLNTNIDVLRSPTTELCHGLPISTIRTPVTIGSSMTVTLAISRLAIQYTKQTLSFTSSVGYCWVEVGGFKISPTVDCVSQLRVGCPEVPGSNTADMCLQEWTFDTMNRDQITCTECVFRWIWKATHLSIANPEPFENCWDITLSGSSSSATGTTSGSSDVPVITPVDVSSPSATNVATYATDNSTGASTSASFQHAETIFYGLLGDTNHVPGSQVSTGQRLN